VTIEIFSPIRRFSRVDLPELGRPMMEAKPDFIPMNSLTGHVVGERLVAVTKVAGVGFRDPMEVTRFQPPRRIDVRHHGRVVRGTGTFLVEPAPGGAWFVWSEDVDLPLGVAGRLGFALVGPAFRLMLRRSLRRLARTVESRSRPGGGRA
jgi:hypothetical protein